MIFIIYEVSAWKQSFPLQLLALVQIVAESAQLIGPFISTSREPLDVASMHRQQLQLQCLAVCRAVAGCPSTELCSAGANGNRRAVPQSPQHCQPAGCAEFGAHTASHSCANHRMQITALPLLWDPGCSPQPAALHRGHSCPIDLQAQDRGRALCRGTALSTL